MIRLRCAVLVVLVGPAFFFMTMSAAAGEAKPNFTKAMIGRLPFDLRPNASAAAGTPAEAVLRGLNGRMIEQYDDATLVDIHANDKEKLEQRGREQNVPVAVHDEFDKVFLNGRVLDTREGSHRVPPGEVADRPYVQDEQGTWLLQFVGPVKSGWLQAIEARGIVAVQYVSTHAYIVAARRSAIQWAAGLPFVQWTSQMHRFLKPSIGAWDAATIELWIELARTEETPDTVAYLAQLSEGPIESAPWSDAELRVQGVFRTADVDVILGQPLVIGVAERPRIGLSDERAALGVTNLTDGNGTSAAQAGRYKKWLSDLCPQCMNLKDDGFYIGIADTGLDGGSGAASGNGDVPGEAAASGLRREEFRDPADPLRKRKVIWGTSYEDEAYLGTETWNPNCVYGSVCPDSTDSKHDVIGHGTLVAGVAAGDPDSTAAKDAHGFLWGLGVAPSAGLLITKINTVKVARTPTAVLLVMRDARSNEQQPAYIQNFSFNQYRQATGCSAHYDGRYTILSRDFDDGVRDGDTVLAGNQPITAVVSAGNVHSQPRPSSSLCAVDRYDVLPPATAKNVIAVGGGENVRPEQWLCLGTRADAYGNLSIDAKQGTATPGRFKPDLIAVSSSHASLLSSDQVVRKQITEFLGGYCQSTIAGFEPQLPPQYRGAAGTSFSAPVGAAGAALASRRYSSDPGAASPALLKAMLIAGAKSMRGGNDRGRVRVWKPREAYAVGERVIPTVPNGRYYEVEARDSQARSADTEPLWPTQTGATVTEWRSEYPTGSAAGWTRWRDQGEEVKIAGFPNEQQGFGRIYLGDVLSEYPARAYVNDAAVSVGGSWNREYKVHDRSLPVRIALVWSDPAKLWSSGDTAPDPLLVNDLDLSVRVFNAGGDCAGRYAGNSLYEYEESIWYQPCSGGQASTDKVNNAEIVRFFASPALGNATFTVRVDFPTGASTQNFALVVWNAYESTAAAPPATPATFTASGISASQVQLVWQASNGATSYEVQRSDGVSGAYTAVGCPATPCTDGGRSPGTASLYRVRARNGSGVSDWAVDAATTVGFTDPAISQTTRVQAVHLTQLREAVAALRAAAGLSAVSWTDDPIVPGATPIRRAHVTELRSALNEARGALGLSAFSFTDSALTPHTSIVKRVHVEELRQAVQ